MRVTHVITRLIVGGAQENTVATVLSLKQKLDIDVHLVSGPTSGPEGSMESQFAKCPELLTIVPSLVRPIHPWKDTVALLGLTACFRRQRPDIVHTHSGKAGVLGRMAARRAGVPVVIHHIHGPSFGSFQGPLSNWIFTAAERHAARATTHFICSAHAMERLYLAAGIGQPEIYTRIFSGFRVEPYLHATNDLALRRELGLNPDAFVIGKIARLAPLKGHDDLFAAFAGLLRELPLANLLIIGGGPLKKQLEARAHEMGIADKTVFTGLIAPDAVPRYTGVMDCLAHLSYREALSRALPQALAAGKPVVSYDFDGADEICLEGRTGFLTRTGDTAAVTDRLLRLARNPDLRTRLGQYGQQFVRDNFPVERMADRIYDLYLKLAAERALRLA